MRIALGQMAIRPGDIAANLETVLAQVSQARAGGADLLVLPELCLCGLLCGGYFADADFVADCLCQNAHIAAAAKDIAVVFGNLGRTVDGRLKNSVYLAQEGEIRELQPFLGQSAIPNAYAAFAETPGAVAELKIKGEPLRLVIALGEAALPQVTDGLPLYLAHRPLDLQRPFDHPNGLWLNPVGLQSTGKTCYLLAGGSAYWQNGQNVAAAELLKPQLLLTDSGQAAQQPKGGDLIFAALVAGVRAFFAANGSKRAVIGLSGGIDSALAACVYCAALGSENVLLINMPSRYNSHLTKDLARDLAAALHSHYAVLSIEESVQATIQQFAQTPVSAPDGSQWYIPLEGLTLENLQARNRSARVLATAAAGWKALFTCNGNKAEAAVGYATFYGDLAGAFAALGDLWKHQVYAASEAAGRYFPEAAGAMAGIAAIRPSAELSPKQSVEEGTGDPLLYDYHDYLLASWVEQGSSPADMLAWYRAGTLEARIGCAPGLARTYFDTPAAFIADLEYWWRMHKGIAVAKRQQAPPILALSSHPFGESRPEAQMRPYFSTRYARLKKELLDD